MIFFEYFGIGLIGSLGLIILSKGIMARLLQRKIDYYQDKYDEGGEVDE